MQSFWKPLLAVCAAAIILIFLSSGQKYSFHKNPAVKQTAPGSQKIQVAILLDVSNSMDGLIDQAKAQLWNMVNTLGRTQCENKQAPQIEIALYEYGTPRNDREGGYIRQINNFITDLDSLSENLFALTTNGGDEYCGHVIFRSVKELKWDTNPNSYKVIFIAGNESFLQGSLSYTKACTEAKSKGIIVNTIYCGDRMAGIRERWNLQAECGNGSFTNINQNEKIDDIPTPYDTLIYTLNEKLNSTYITYGNMGAAYYSKQQRMDKENSMVSKKAGIKRAEAKSKSNLYNNSSWDLVDKSAEGEVVFDQIDFKTLPDSLQKKTKEQLKVIVTEKRKERSSIQTQIIALNQKRDEYIRTNKNNTSGKPESTLETEVERILREQVTRYGMTIQQ